MSNHLSMNHYTMPGKATQTMIKKDLKETLLATGGWVIAYGECWNIKSNHLGAGVYSVTLVRKFDK